jgi:hypothetical protein
MRVRGAVIAVLVLAVLTSQLASCASEQVPRDITANKEAFAGQGQPVAIGIGSGGGDPDANGNIILLRPCLAKWCTSNLPIEKTLCTIVREINKRGDQFGNLRLRVVSQGKPDETWYMNTTFRDLAVELSLRANGCVTIYHDPVQCRPPKNAGCERSEAVLEELFAIVCPALW